MGYTTSISEYELSRGDGVPPCEGDEIDGGRHVKSKVVTPEEKKDPISATVAETKDV